MPLLGEPGAVLEAALAFGRPSRSLAEAEGLAVALGPVCGKRAAA